METNTRKFTTKHIKDNAQVNVYFNPEITTAIEIIHSLDNYDNLKKDNAALQKALSTLTGMHSNLKEDNALLLEALRGLYEFNLGKSYYLDILLNNAEYAIQKTESK